MPTVINATQEDIQLKLRGNYFSWKPGQRKVIRDETLAQFIQTDRGDYGLAVIPDLMQDDEEVTPEQLEERRAAMKEVEEKACSEALDRYLKRLRSIVANNQISLRRDLEQSNIKADPGAFASDGELKAMELVLKYQKRAEDAEGEKIKRVKELTNAIKGK